MVNIPFAFSQASFTLPNENTSNSGHITLTWEGHGDAAYTLQKSDNSNFEKAEIIYQGPDRASFISGLKNGDYFFRVKTENAPWSGPLLVKVEHHSLQLAFSLAGVGLFVFLSIVYVIILGTRNSAKT